MVSVYEVAKAVYDTFAKYFDVGPEDLIRIFGRSFNIMKEFLDRCIKHFKGVKIIAVVSETEDLKIRVCGETFPIREMLKKASFSWDPFERCWVKRYELSKYTDMIADAEGLVRNLRDTFILVVMRLNYGLINGSVIRDIVAKKDEADKELLDALKRAGYTEGHIKEKVKILIIVQQTPDPE
ncbi:MAG: hypothetical protein C0179_07170, partial [Fervidicoccus sp.]